jgi:hypothetical protein
MPDLLTYRVQMRCTIRSEASTASAILRRMGPTADGKPRLIQGRALVPGWVEVVDGDVILGYIKAGALRELKR